MDNSALTLRKYEDFYRTHEASPPENFPTRGKLGYQKEGAGLMTEGMNCRYDEVAESDNHYKILFSNISKRMPNND